MATERIHLVMVSTKKIVLLGDIHSNIEALDAVLAVLKGKDIDAIYHVGDVVGYCTDFEKVIQQLIQNDIRGVIGNHELMVIGELCSDHCIARDAVIWTADRISEQVREYIKSLPPRLRIDDVVIFHAEPESYTGYVSSEKRAEKVFDKLDKTEPDWHIAFHGHTHKQRVFERKSGVVRLVLEGEGEFRLDPDCHYLVSPGSVGVSRDNDPRTGYMIYEAGVIQQFRIDYDWRACQQKIDRAELKTRLFVKERGVLRELLSRILGRLQFLTP